MKQRKDSDTLPQYVSVQQRESAHANEEANQDRQTRETRRGEAPCQSGRKKCRCAEETGEESARQTSCTEEGNYAQEEISSHARRGRRQKCHGTGHSEGTSPRGNKTGSAGTES